MASGWCKAWGVGRHARTNKQAEAAAAAATPSSKERRRRRSATSRRQDKRSPLRKVRNGQASGIIRSTQQRMQSLCLTSRWINQNRQRRPEEESGFLCKADSQVCCGLQIASLHDLVNATPVRDVLQIGQFYLRADKERLTANTSCICAP
eukprot:SAG31_NODE_14776_length_788_cov_0.896952_1_plen_150_part_00